MSRNWVVRVVQTDRQEGGEIGDAFLECMRYAGHVILHDVDPAGLTHRCFDIQPPHGVSTKPWAEMNAERMRSFGFNAVAAPSTK